MMNYAIFRRLLTFRGCNRIISSGYCDSGKVNNISNDKTFSSHDTSDVATESSQVKEINQLENKTSSTTTHETRRTSSETLQQLEEKLSITSSTDTGKCGEERLGSPAPVEENHEVAPHTERTEAVGSGFENERKKKPGAEMDGFLVAYKKHEKLRNKQLKGEEFPTRSTETFASLFRKSPFVDMGDPTGKVVVGEVYLVVDNDLYIDFGWKFHAVCSKPRRNPEYYVAGAKVLLRINDLELNARFLGEKSYISLLEADCELIGLAYGMEKDPKTVKKEKSAS